MTQAGTSTLSTPQLSAPIPSALERNMARDLHRPATPIRSWIAMLARVIGSGLLNRDLRRGVDDTGVDRADVETLRLIHRAFGKRHS